MSRAFLLSAITVTVVLGASFNDRYKDYRDYGDNDVVAYRQTAPVTHTFPNRTQCILMCDVPCTVTNVYMGTAPMEMFTCHALKPPKVTVLGSLKANSFYMTLVVLGVITLAIILLLTLCFCCSYCCRPPVSSRGSSKDALNPQDDGEFREYLNESDIGAIRKERDFSRRTRTAQIV